MHTAAHYTHILREISFQPCAFKCYRYC